MSEDITNNKSLTTTAHIISDTFSPILVPVYAMIVAMWLTPLCFLPLKARLWATVAVAGITAVAPLAVIALLMRLGKVSDMSISNPRQRTIPYVVSVICFVGAAAYLYFLHAEAWLVTFYLGAALVSAISLVITHWWKISAHTGGVGGLAAGIFWLAKNGLLMSAPLLWVCLAFAIVGLVAWSRLYLRRHTLMQVFAGAVMAFCVVYTLISLT